MGCPLKSRSAAKFPGRGATEQESCTPIEALDRFGDSADSIGSYVAQIELRPDNVITGTWWLVWVDRDEVVGRILQDGGGKCQIAPQGPHWSPMKSFGGKSYDTRSAALAEVTLYFRER
jgi:hypothetical protein